MIVGCEFSGVVRRAFRARGHEAFSCDLLPAEDGGEHLLGDVLGFIDRGWDLAIFHPPCTFLTCTANKWHLPQYKERFPNREQDRLKAIEFFMALACALVPKIAIENPIGIMSTRWRKPDCIVQPWQFGDDARKATCFWLKNLPPLLPIGRMSEKLTIHQCKSGKTMSTFHTQIGSSRDKKLRAHLRSVTFPGIARAMSEQWG